MKKISLNQKREIKLVLILILILNAGNLFAQQPTFNWLGTLGGNFSRAFGVSANGSVVVGVSNTSNYEERAFRWTLANGMENLGTLGGNQSVANAVSADGSIIVGYSRDSADIKRAFKWTAATGMQDLGGGDWTEAVAISNDGSVVIVNNGMDGFAYRWTASGMDNLGTLGGSQTIAYDVSADGSVIVGLSYVAATDPYAFRWISGAGIQQIGTFYSFAYGVSADGNTVSGDGSIIVGDGGDGAFRLSNAGGLEYLHQVYSNLINPGSELVDAVDISPNGLFIVGFGTNSLTTLDEGYLLSVNGVSSVSESGNNPGDFSLEQNYPNPFNPSTSIQYAIASRQFVQLRVFDVLGNEIATLVNEEKSPGVYNIEFGTGSTELSSGIYFYKITAGDFVQTKKMILVK